MMTKEIERMIKRHANSLMTDIITDMFESYYFCKETTCEEVGEVYIKAITELVNRLIETQDRYPLYVKYVKKQK